MCMHTHTLPHTRTCTNTHTRTQHTHAHIPTRAHTQNTHQYIRTQIHTHSHTWSPRTWRSSATQHGRLLKLFSSVCTNVSPHACITYFALHTVLSLVLPYAYYLVTQHLFSFSSQVLLAKWPWQSEPRAIGRSSLRSAVAQPQKTVDGWGDSTHMRNSAQR